MAYGCRAQATAELVASSMKTSNVDSYFEALRGYLEAHGCAVAFYSDRHSVFRDKDLPNRPGVRLRETY